MAKWVECKRFPKQGDFVVKRALGGLIAGVVGEVDLRYKAVYGRAAAPPDDWISGQELHRCHRDHRAIEEGRPFSIGWNATARILKQV